MGRPVPHSQDSLVAASDLSTHLVIPDTQVKPGVPVDHLRWIGKYILEVRPTTVIHLGDHWDMHSLSSYDKGKIQFEGRRYNEDVQVGNDAFALLNEPLEDFNARKVRFKEKQWWPRRVILRGNHEERINRAIQDNPVLDGTIGYDDLDVRGWEAHGFLEPVFIDGVGYSHYWYNPMNGRPYSGQASTRLKTVGHSFTMGHQQTLDYALRFVQGRSQHALVAGACYQHDEDYKGPQGNAHWRGIIVKHQVEDGSYDPMFVSLDYLCRKYEGMRLTDFQRSLYCLHA